MRDVQSTNADERQIRNPVAAVGSDNNPESSAGAAVNQVPLLRSLQDAGSFVIELQKPPADVVCVHYFAVSQNQKRYIRAKS